MLKLIKRACRYGMKMDAAALLQEWVADIGAAAGLTPFNSVINSGAIGVPESRLEVRPDAGIVRQ